MSRNSETGTDKEDGGSGKKNFLSASDLEKLLQIHPKDFERLTAHLTDKQRKLLLEMRDKASEASAQVNFEYYDLIGRFVPVWRGKAAKLKRVADMILDEIEDDRKAIQRARDLLPNMDWADENVNVKDVEDLEEDLRYRESTDLNSTYLLLAGFAMETVVKGFCLLRHPDLIEGANFDRRLATHNLPWIADQLHLVLSEEERQLLGRLERTIVWEGRYPIPRNPEAYRKCTEENLKNSALSELYDDSFELGDAPTVFNKLYFRLHIDLFLEWAQKVMSGGYDQRTQDFIKDVWLDQKD
jgi:hypothetical protein